MFLVDSHCHLNLLDLNLVGGDLNVFVERAKANDVNFLLNVCVSMSTFPAVLQAAETYPFVAASVGLHPNETDEQVTLQELLELGQHKKVVAIGETGLDYYRSTGELTWQRDRFRDHIQAAKTLAKPLIIHTRNAKDDTLKVMRAENASEIGGVMHCFSEDWEMAKAALDMNFYISFSGVVTFKSAAVLQEVATKVPADRILIETDCPYLAPLPHRGKPNEPAYVRHTAEFIAALRGESLEAFAEQSTQNFFTLFKGAERPYV